MNLSAKLNASTLFGAPLVSGTYPSKVRVQRATRSTNEDKYETSYETTPKPKPRVKPGSFFALAKRNFSTEASEIGKAFVRVFDKSGPERAPQCFGFTLSNEAIMQYEKENPPPGAEDTPYSIQVLYDVVLFFVDRLFVDRAIERFWFLETVARIPYFSYVTCLHLYETLGWWRTAKLRKIHFAEEWNELHHLLIMEALGGDARWRDRFLAFHAAIIYYWILVVSFLVSPKYSYKFSELLETHAVSTYRTFLVENEAKLRQIPAPKIAQEYYKHGDLYMFDADSEFVRDATGSEVRRPPVDNLYDIFTNILDDEWEHVKTMVMCQDYDSVEELMSGTGNDTEVSDASDEKRQAVRAKWKTWANSLQSREHNFLQNEASW
eukprot:CAMPEP_0198203624 /NCGR_PEP_ID=MMETSP1445-20131203/6933_1 /TAXON_ID=36898 /ORGANISM="Pyramimonas sp., Strain CCMP2087" /LENGTH=378 /DNA_ID=CAMNT_0043875089 /DNA_START=40 /DNA_END=1176 /DNA_ORIENTATION=+